MSVYPFYTDLAGEKFAFHVFTFVSKYLLQEHTFGGHSNVYDEMFIGE